MEFQINQDLIFQTNETLKKKYEEIKIEKYYQEILPSSYKILTGEENTSEEKQRYQRKKGIELNRQDEVIIDFGDHRVGRLNFEIETLGSPPDAPLKFHFSLGETLEEVTRDFSSYQGELSSSWLQEELITVKTLPAKIDVPNRYAFRYMKLRIIDTSPKYRVCIYPTCTSESAVKNEQVTLIENADDTLREIDLVSQKTLAHCMHDVFEDGPKRDQRLWLGDLRLQALANYATFEVNALVKKCLYAFAAITTEEGQVSANVFVEPELIPDDTFLADYSLFFIDTLLDYFEATKDQETLEDLYATAVNQYKVLEENILSNGKLYLEEGWWAFIDWNPELDKEVAIHGVFIYSLKRLSELATIMSDKDLVTELATKIEKMSMYAIENYYSVERALFISPDSQQISLASQTWMVLANIGSLEMRRNVLAASQKLEKSEYIGCNTPYMYHHYIEALFKEGFNEEATSLMKMYWGGMLKEGADTFWEAYNPEKENFSPYGDKIINSYCHAWSCTPCYLLRKYDCKVSA